MGHITDNPGLDESRPAPTYGDPVGESAIKRLMRGRPLTNWMVTGPGARTVNPRAHRVHGEDGDHEWLPEAKSRPLQLSLMPEVAIEVLRLLDAIAEPLPSRSGQSYTFRLKKNAAAILADHDGDSSTGNDQETEGRRTIMSHSTANPEIARISATTESRTEAYRQAIPLFGSHSTLTEIAEAADALGVRPTKLALDVMLNLYDPSFKVWEAEA